MITSLIIPSLIKSEASISIPVPPSISLIFFALESYSIPYLVFVSFSSAYFLVSAIKASICSFEYKASISESMYSFTTLFCTGFVLVSDM